MSEPSVTGTDKHRKGSWLRVAFRLLLILLIGTGIGVGIFYGASYLARNFFEAVQSNTDDLAILTTRLDQLDAQVNTRLDDLAARMDTLELQNDDQKLLLSEIETSVADLEILATDVEDRLLSMEEANEELVEAVSSQDEAISAVETQTTNLEESLTGINAELEELSAQVDTLNIFLEEWVVSTSDYESTIQQFKALMLLSRVQLNISQSNYGLARQDIVSAYEIIQILAADAETGQEYAGILERLDSALLNLPDTPIPANADIESAWNNLWAMIDSGTETPSESDEELQPTEEP